MVGHWLSKSKKNQKSRSHQLTSRCWRNFLRLEVFIALVMNKQLKRKLINSVICFFTGIFAVFWIWQIKSIFDAQLSQIHMDLTRVCILSSAVVGLISLVGLIQIVNCVRKLV